MLRARDGLFQAPQRPRPLNQEVWNLALLERFDQLESCRKQAKHWQEEYTTHCNVTLAEFASNLFAERAINL
jgi:hypothetical protein